MADIIHYNNCPVCGAAELKTVMRVKDYLVSGELFELAECSTCGVRITQDAPGAGTIDRYYKSEEYISHSNTKKGIINRLYHQVRKYTLVQKRKWVEKWTRRQQGRLLDIGAGSGAFVAEMKGSGWEVTGLEPDPQARKVAQQDHGIVLNDISLLGSLPPGTFDAITLWHVLEHVHDLQGYIRKIHELLAPDGVLFIAVPNYESADAVYFAEYWAAYDVPRHLYHFSPGSMQQLLNGQGLEIASQIAMRFDSYYVSLLSNKAKTGSNRFFHSFWKGFQSNLRAKRYGASSMLYIAKKQQ